MPFARILRSSALMGGAQVVVLAAGFVRAKAIALILGASGVGLIGIFNAFSGNVSSLAGWGLGTSGVRLIAGAQEDEKPSKVAAVRRFGWTLSLLGLGGALIAFWPVARVTFASGQYATEMAIVALAVPCVIASSMWSAIVQASGRIASLAKVQVAGALTGLLLGLPAIYLWGTLGIALSIFLAAAVPAFVLWRTAHAACPPPAIAHVDRADLRQLAKLGGALMVVGWLGQLSAYVVRLAIVRQEGLEAAGYYQAAFAISGSLPGFVFAAMGADFFPRVAAAKDEVEALEITEKQILACLLLGSPLIVALLTLGKLSIHLLYADTFDASIPLLTWMTWGVFMRLVSWPLGYRMLARGSSRVLIVFEGAAGIIAAIAPAFLMKWAGLNGAAMGFFWASALYAMAQLAYLRWRFGVMVGWVTLQTVAAAMLLIFCGQLSAMLMPGQFFGIIPTVISTLISWVLYRRMAAKEANR